MSGLTDYRGLQVPSDDPTGAAGAALKDDLKLLVDWSPKSNYTAGTNPTVDDDITADYYPGSFWLNTTTNTFFLCASNADGSAVWVELVKNSFYPGVAVISNTYGKLDTLNTLSDTQVGYLNGVTSNIQSQLDSKAATSAIPTTTNQLTNDSGFITGTTGFNGSGTYTSFTIANGLITNAT